MRILEATYLDVLSLVLWYNTGEPTSLVDRTRRHFTLLDQTVLDRNPVIVFSEGRSLVNDTSS